LGQPEAAIEHYREALEVDPNNTPAATVLGSALMQEGDHEGAIAQRRRAVDMDPENAEAHYYLGFSLLLLGLLEEGWTEFEWRWRVEGGEKKRDFPQPYWEGGNINGKSILVWSEQGVGDEVQFAGMIPDLLSRGADVVLECEPRLVPLFERSFPGVRCLPKQDPPVAEAISGDIDFQVPGAGLGRWLRADFAEFPGRASYLVADTEHRETLQARYREGSDDLLVGVAWHSKNADIGQQKSMTLLDLRPIADVPGVRFIDLQYGDTADERAAFEEETGIRVHRDDSVDQMKDLDAFAAQVAAMDLVVSVSNTTVHIAGALGVPAWVLLHHLPLSVWMLDRDDSPWYPSLRLFRQTEAGQWADVIERVTARLADLASG